MSANKAISPENAAAAVAAAAAAFAQATTVEELQAAKTAHVGDASALAQMNALLRDLPASEKAAAGKLMGESRATVGKHSRRERVSWSRRESVNCWLQRPWI